METIEKKQFTFKHKTKNDAEYSMGAFANSEKEARELVIQDLEEILDELNAK